jgi:hypothetical protein
MFLFAGCAGNEVASNSPDDLNVAASDVTSSDGVVDTSGLNNELPPTTSAEAAPSAAPVSKINVSAASSSSATSETNILNSNVKPIARVARHRHKRRRHHHKSVLAHHKHHKKHHVKHSIASVNS